MKQFNINPNEKNEFSQVASVDIFAPDDYKQYAYHHLKEEFGMQLYSILEQCKSPSVVTLDEEISRDGYREFMRVRAFVTPVQYEHIVIQIPEYQFWNTKKKSIWQRLVSHFTRK